MYEKQCSLISSKQCNKCGITKDRAEFSKNSTKPDGLQVWCKLCRKEHDAEYYLNNRVKLSAVRALYKQNNREKVMASSLAYYAKNKGILAEKQKIYGLQHKEKRRATQNKSEQKRLHENVEFLLKKRLRIRLHSALKNNQKTGSAISDLGCSVQHLKLHLELFWDEGMSWLNYGFGKGKWNIDHIKPLALFNLSDRDQLLRAVHFTNLQPLWHEDNLAKRDTAVIF